MDPIFVTRGATDAVPIWFVTAANYADVRKVLGPELSVFAEAAGFEAKAGRSLLLPGQNGKGAVVPIKIGGTKDHPAFGLDLHDKNNNVGAPKDQADKTEDTRNSVNSARK